MDRVFLLFFIIPVFFIGGCDKKPDVIKKLPGFRQQAAHEYSYMAIENIKYIYEESKLYAAENGEFPGDVDELTDSGYLFSIRASVFYQWDFELNIYDDDDGSIMGTIIATSLDEMPGGAGEQVVFDCVTEKFCGYGQKDDCETP